MKFELNRLRAYDDESVLAELRRVAELVPPDQPLTAARFNALAKVDSSTVRHRFGGWANALAAAGLADRYSGRTVSGKMKSQHARTMTDDELVSELRRVASDLGSESLTQPQFESASRISASVIRRRFGSWGNALSAAGLHPVPLGRRYSDDDYFENLLLVWTSLGRQPHYAEMGVPPSTITPGAYERRFGRWSNALAAFVERVATPNPERSVVAAVASAPSQAPVPLESRRKIPLSLRYSVLKRDNFKCVLCGSSPASDPTCRLHVDHIVPFAKGGPTTPANLRTLCESCNLGKADRA